MTASETSDPIRILIADDHPVVREGLAAMIERQPDMSVVAEAGTGREAVERALEHRPDIVLMDLRMPELGGVEATVRLRERLPSCQVIVLTTYDGDQEIVRALQAGARAYLLKDTFRADLMSAVRAVHAGERRIPGSVARRLAEHVANPGLTHRELEVLRLMASGGSNREIARALYVTESTIKGHVNNILSKLGVRHRTHAVTVAVRRGIITLPEP
jgi:two-component system NarL family response regulator